MAQVKLIRQMKTDTKRGVPRLPDDSYIIGVTKLFSAFPSSGKVTAIPKAKASYFPLNQKETMLA
jgi:hypothetical protein